MRRKVFVDIDKCLGCRSCEIACAVEHSLSRDLHKAFLEAEKPHYRIFVTDAGGHAFPLVCRQCEEPECLIACKSGGISYDPELGGVIFDADRCVGCWMCVMNCPFGVIYMGHIRGIAEKCDLCLDRDIFACVEACPTKAIKIIEMEEVDG